MEDEGERGNQENAEELPAEIPLTSACDNASTDNTAKNEDLRHPSSEYSDDESGSDYYGSIEDDVQASSGTDKRDDEMDYLLDIPMKVPNDSTECSSSAQHFQQMFEGRRYGDVVPSFVPGGLNEAMQRSLNSPLEECLPLLIYLHHDDSIITNIFCSRVLCNATVVEFLSSNFITWACDITSPSEKHKLVNDLKNVLGCIVSNAVNNLRLDELPIFLIVMRCTPPELLGWLKATHLAEEFLNHLLEAQDLCQRSKEHMLIHQAKVETLAASLPMEPDDSFPTNEIRTLHIRCFDETIISRRFRAEDLIGSVHAFLATKGIHPEEYRLLTSFNKELTKADGDRTLDEVHLRSDEYVILLRV